MTEKQLIAEAEAISDDIAVEYFFFTQVPGKAIQKLREKTNEHLVHFYNEGRKAGLEEAAKLCFEHAISENRWANHYGPTGKEPDQKMQFLSAQGRDVSTELLRSIRALIGEKK